MSFRKLLLILLAAYLAVLAVIYAFQRDLVYLPPDNSAYAGPSQAKVSNAFDELAVTTEDGLDLKGLYALAKTKKLTIVFFHGTGDSARTIARIANPYIEAGYGFLIVEYRGYGGLKGKPTESGLYADARAYLHALISRGLDEKSLVLFGASLGTGVATQMATEFHSAGLILLAPFLSAAKIAQMRFPFLPAELLTLDRYENFSKIVTIKTALLIGHGAKDTVVPVSDGKRLYDLANNPKEFHLFLEGQHSNLPDVGFTPISLVWLERLCSATCER